jgi:dGTPase
VNRPSPSPRASATSAATDWICQREAALLAPWAMHSADTQGRRHPEPAHPYRGPFQRDRDRIVHSAAYRRLSYKTQVFTGEMGDYHRTRLTHTLEVASLARTLARALRLNEDLVEALALTHDIGHPPFGHAGEDVLDECLADEGGFSHNRQGIRIVEVLENRYREFPGLNLSLEILEGQQYRATKDLREQRPLLEVQVVDAADSIAYNTHDADDALELRLLELEELVAEPLWSEAAGRVRRRYADLAHDELRRAVLHELIDWQVGDLLARTQRRLGQGDLDSVEAVRQAELIVVPDPEIAEMKVQFQRFLYQRVYRHATVLAMRSEVQQALRIMFAGFVERSSLLPGKFQQIADRDSLPRAVGDYLSGMTDRFAQQEYQRLFASRAR